MLKEEHKIRVIHSQEWEHANPQDVVDFCFNLYRKHWNTWFFVDGSNRSFVNQMKVAFNESLNWDKDSVNPEVMKVLPVNFNTEHKEMLTHLHMLVNKEYLCVPKEHDKLNISLRTA
jgi:plasmid maintenance system killer protein